MGNDSDQTHQGSWRLLVRGEHLGVVVVLAGGVALYATNVFLTASLLPSAIAEIGGQSLYAWTTTLFLLASVMSSVLVTRLLHTAGSRGAYAVALSLFTAGTLVCAVTPSMAGMLGGRVIQGLGGGLLAGLGYALIRSALPASLWTRGTATISAMWGVGTFIGPALGGALAEYLDWRAAFIALAVGAVAVGAVVPRTLSTRRTETNTSDTVPWLSLLLLTGAALVVSAAGLLATTLAGVAGVVIGVGLIGLFLAHEYRRPGGVLPRATFARGSPLRWIYLTIGLLAMGSTVELFVPYFAQVLAGLGPLAAGFLGAAIAAGWTAGEIPSAGASSPFVVRRLVVGGVTLLAAGLGIAALAQQAEPGSSVVAFWVAAFLLAGTGIGIAWPHLANGAMRCAQDTADADRAAAAINTVQLVANAFGTALAGLLVNIGGGGDVFAGRLLYAGLATLTAVAIIPAVLLSRSTPSPSRV